MLPSHSESSRQPASDSEDSLSTGTCFFAPPRRSRRVNARPSSSADGNEPVDIQNGRPSRAFPPPEKLTAIRALDTPVDNGRGAPPPSPSFLPVHMFSSIVTAVKAERT